MGSSDSKGFIIYRAEDRHCHKQYRTSQGAFQYLPCRDTDIGISLTVVEFILMFINKRITHKKKSGVLGVILGTSTIYLFTHTSSLIRHLYTAAIFEFPFGLFIGGIFGTIFGGACVYSMSFFGNFAVLDYISKAISIICACIYRKRNA